MVLLNRKIKVWHFEGFIIGTVRFDRKVGKRNGEGKKVDLNARLRCVQVCMDVDQIVVVF